MLRDANICGIFSHMRRHVNQLPVVSGQRIPDKARHDKRWPLQVGIDGSDPRRITHTCLRNSVSGRAYPDVAAQGEGFQVVVGGRTESVAGTSASSPVSLTNPPTQAPTTYYALTQRRSIRRLPVLLHF